MKLEMTILKNDQLTYMVKELGHRRLLNIAIIFSCNLICWLTGTFHEKIFLSFTVFRSVLKSSQKLELIGKITISIIACKQAQVLHFDLCHENGWEQLLTQATFSEQIFPHDFFQILFEKSHLLTVYTLYCVYTCKIRIRTTIFSQPSFHRVAEPIVMSFNIKMLWYKIHIIICLKPEVHILRHMCCVQRTGLLHAWSG